MCFDASNFRRDFRQLELDSLFPSTMQLREFSSMPFHRPKVQSLLSLVYPEIRRRFKTIKEEEVHSIEDLFNQVEESKSVFLVGYWQKREIYEPVVDSIKAELRLPKFKTRHKGISMKNRIAVHVRLSDYLNPLNNAIFTQLDDAYYQRAAEKLSESMDECQMMIFSDSPSLMKEKFNFWRDYDSLFACDYCKNHLEEFALMTDASRFILANSTFSYWASLLAEKQQGISRVFPNSYYQDPVKDGIYTEGKFFIFDETTCLT